MRAWRAITSIIGDKTRQGNATLCFPVEALVHRESLAAKPAVGNCAGVRFRGCNGPAPLIALGPGALIR